MPLLLLSMPLISMAQTSPSADNTQQSSSQNNSQTTSDEELQQFFLYSESFLPNEPDSVIQLSLSFINENRDIPGTHMARIYDNIAKSYFYKGYYNLAEDYFKQALSLPEVQNSQPYQRVLTNNLGAVLDKLGRFEESITYYLQALEIEKQIGTPLEIAEVYNNMSQIFYQTNDTTSALEMINMAEALVDTMAAHPFKGLLAMNRGNILYEMGRETEAGILYLEAAQIFGEFGFYRDQVQTLHNYLRNVLQSSAPEVIDFGQLYAVWDEAWTLTKEFSMTELQAYLTIVRADLEIRQGDPAEALRIYMDAEERFKEMADRPDLIPIEVYAGMLAAYQQTGDTDGMMQTITRMDEIRTEKNLTEQTKAIQEIKIELDVAETELALKRKETEAAQVSLELEQQRIRTRLMFVFSTFVILLAAGVFMYHRVKIKNLKDIYYVNQRSKNKFQILGYYSGYDSTEKTGRMQDTSMKPDLLPSASMSEVEREDQNAEAAPMEDTPLQKEKGLNEKFKDEAFFAARESQDETLDSNTSDANTSAYEADDTLPQGVHLWVHQKVMGVMKTDKLYQDPDIRLADVAHKVGVGSRSISKTILFYENMSFKDYINELRVLEAMSFLEEEEKNYLSLESVMENCGFKNRSTFHAVFQKICGMTPNQYRKISQMEKRKDAVPTR